MGFFKDFKDDFSQAVNELMPGEDNLESGTNEDDLVVNTLEGEVDVESELSKLDGLLEQVTKQEAEKAAAAKKAAAAAKAAQAAKMEERPVAEPVAAVNTENVINAIQEEKKMADTMTTPVTPATTTAAPVMQNEEISDETSVITEGTVIKGDIVSNGSLDVRGQVDGNVGCNGKLVVTGVVNGNSNASEVFADAAKIEGEVVSTGTVKIGLGSVIIGNVTSTSAVIAGAIKGDIDVQGPVVVDTSAVVMGNIKSRSVQINNGAVIEGFCSQCYSDVDVQSLFDSKKGM
ncbi:MAG: polymer-forming cytoskeletal protein [Roseburia sp.]|nr:polymer-forming cytoskeletal protein [Roseburia sp.]